MSNLGKPFIQRPQSIKLGAFYAIISAFCFAVMSVFVKLIGHALPTSILVFFRFSISLLIFIPFVLTDQNFTLKIQEPARHLIRILAALSALSMTFYAIKFIPLVDALLLNNTTPLFVPLFVWWLARVKTPRKACVGIALGFMGITLILNPDHKIFHTVSLLALASGGLSALAIVQVRLISKSSSPKQMLFYYFLVSTIITGLIAARQWQNPTDWHMWLLLLGLGIFGTVYQTCATLAYATAPVRYMSPFIFLMVIFGGFFDFLLWGYVPSILTLLGAALVIFGAIITVYYGQKELTKK